MDVEPWGSDQAPLKTAKGVKSSGTGYNRTGQFSPLGLFAHFISRLSSRTPVGAPAANAGAFSHADPPLQVVFSSL